MTSGRSATSGTLWMATNGAVSQGLSFGVFIVLARMMAPADYGLIALSMTVISILIAGSRLGLEKLLVQLESAGRTETDTAFFFSVLLGSILALALWLSAPVIAALVATPDLEPVLRALAPVVVLKAFEAVPLGLLTRELRFKAISLGTTLALAAGGIAGIAMALNGFGVWALVSQEIVKATLSLAALSSVCGWRPGLSVSLKAGRNMLAASLHIMAADIIRLAQNYTDRFLIGSLLGASSLGVYTVAAKVDQSAAIILHEPLGRVGLSTLSRARGNATELASVYYRSQRIGAAVTLPVFVMLALTAPSVVPLLLGQHWQDCVPILQALCVASCAGSVRVFNNPLLLAVGRPEVAFRLSILSAVTGLVACVIAIPWGILAVSIAFALRAWLILPLELSLCRRYAGIPGGPVWAGLAGRLLTLVPMILVVVGFQSMAPDWRPWPLLISTVLMGIATYALALTVTDRPLARLLLAVPASLLRRNR